ncbi:hypothetical protein [Kineococcus sp. SYSU DK006]|uniref:hypothetical protein n=1 Tax=Kineococcus sp. SYSU DK006 TaxID=3383127 RepID=UPI003D7CF1A0
MSEVTTGVRTGGGAAAGEVVGAQAQTTLGTVPRPRSAAAARALEAARRGVRWLQGSGIQSPSGGYHSWFDRTTRVHPFEYSEVTGYQVTLAAWLAARGDLAVREVALGDAERAVQWLTTAVQPVPGAFRCLEASAAVGRFAAKADRLYTFDAGIILQGLVAHHAATGSPTAARAALDTGEWLLRHVDAAGVVQPWPATAEAGRWQDAPGDWSTRPGVHHAKIGIGLAALGELTGEQRFTRAAVAVCEDALRRQLPSGRFVTNPGAGTTNVHPHSYAAEALWAVGTATGRADLLDASERATLWALAATDRDGLPPRRYGVDASGAVQVVRHPRVDGVAQVLRLAALHSAHGTSAAQRLVAALLAHQVSAPDEPRADGGFAFGAGTDGTPLPHANVWVTAFAVQALVLAAGDRRGAAVLDWRHLV